jgi:predicted MFS family arabinose efflux permease
MKQGISYIRRREGMQALMALAFCMTALGIPMMTFLPVFVKRFHGDASVYTIFLVCSGLGSITGSLSVAAFGNIRRKGRLALGLLICLGAGIAGFAMSPSVPVSGLMLFLSGAALIGVFTMVNSLVQLIVTNEMRGRVMSVYNFAFRGGMPFGNLLTGWLVPMYTAPVVLAVNGVVLMLVGVYFLLWQRRMAAL